MRSTVALVLYYTKANRYSFNALVGAIESREYFDNLNVYFFEQESQLITGIHSLVEIHEKVVVGLSFFTTQLWDVYRVVKRLREEHHDKLILIAGGPHPTGDPVGTLKMGFDLVVRGEGEEALLELLERIDRDEDYTTIKGIAFFDQKGQYQYTGRRAWVDLDRYPPFAFKHAKFGHIEITRGCPYACYFCQTPRIFGGRPRHRSVETISRYVQVLKERKLTDIRFITPNAFSYGSRDGKNVDLFELEELLRSVKTVIEPTGRLFFGSFPSEVRPEHVLPETLALVIKYADNDNLIIGAQSGSQRILDLCHRGHTVEDVYRAVELTLKAGLKANVDFIFGLPEENEEDIGLTIKVMADLVNMGARVHAHTFLPLPQTPFSKAPAGHIAKDVRRMITALTAQGAAYGDWREQERIARRIVRYLRTGKLEA